MPVNSGCRGGSRRRVTAHEHNLHPALAACVSTTATSTGVRATRATGASTTRTVARRGTSERRRMGHMAAARGVRVRVQDGAAARRCDMGG